LVQQKRSENEEMIDEDRLLEARIEALEGDVHAHGDRLGKLEDAMEVLRVDVARMSARLESVPTREDVALMEGRLINKIDVTFSGLLQKALDAVPLKQAALWAGVAAIMAAAMLVVALVPKGL
jgi:predicted nuclease with TOPRIM domain